MAAQKPLVLVGARLQQLAATDTLAAATPAAGDNSNNLATTAWTQNAIQAPYIVSIAALRAFPFALLTAISTSYVVDVQSYFAGGGGPGGGKFVWNASSTATDDSGLVINPTGNTGAGRWLRLLPYDEVMPQMFGFVGNGNASSVGDTQAFQAALNTGLTVYFPALGSQQQFVFDGTSTGLKLVTQNQRIYGDGAATSVITVAGPNANNANILGIFYWGVTNLIGPRFEDIGIIFGQNQSGGYTGLTQYCPAFYLRACPGFKISRCSITDAWVGIDMKDNSGGSTIRDLAMSAWRFGFDIDGCLDSVIVDNLHWFPYGISATGLYYGNASEGQVTFSTKAGSVGNGSIVLDPYSSAVNTNTGAFPQIGTYRIVFTSPTAFTYYDPTGAVIGASLPTGSPIRSQMNFSVTVGSTAWVAGDEIDIVLKSIPPICFNLGRMDDLHISNSLFLGGLGLSLYNSAAQTTPYNNGGGGFCGGEISNCDFDTTSAIAMTVGALSIASTSFSLAYNNGQILDQEGGVLSLTGCYVIVGRSASPLPIFRIGSATVGNDSFSMAGTFFAMGTNNPIIRQEGTLSSKIQACTFQVQSGSSGYAVFDFYGGRTIFMGNDCYANAGGPFMRFNTDNAQNRVIGNASNGNTNNIPSSPLGVYQYN